MSLALKLLQYRSEDTHQPPPEAYVIVKSGKYSYYSSVGQIQNCFLNFSDELTIRLDKSVSARLNDKLR